MIPFSRFDIKGQIGWHHKSHVSNLSKNSKLTSDINLTHLSKNTELQQEFAFL